MKRAWREVEKKKNPSRGFNTLKKALELFPYESFRSNQMILLNRLLKKDRVILHAPTGFGKTAVVLSAVLSKMNLAEEKLLIFTRTKQQILDVYINEFGKIMDKGIGLNVIPLVGKGDYCLIDNLLPKSIYHGMCRNLKCPLRKVSIGNDDERNGKVEYILETLSKLIRNGRCNLQNLKELLSAFGCPFYATYNLLSFSDIVVTSHTYLVNYKLREHLLESLQAESDEVNVIVDEAHNLREIVMKELPFSEIEKAKTLLRKNPLFGVGKVGEWIKELSIISPDQDEVETPHVDVEEYDAFFHSLIEGRPEDVMIQLLKKASSILNCLDFLTEDMGIVLVDENGLKRVEPFPDQVFRLFSDVKNMVLMSGSIQPLNEYAQLYHLPKFEKIVIPQSTFLNSLNLCISDTKYTSKFEERDESQSKLFAKAVEKIHKASPNHTTVFTSSYTLMKNIYKNLKIQTKYLEKQNISQVRWIKELKEKKHELILGVAGGKISEGIEIVDPQGRSMISTIIIVGLPYPVPSKAHEALMKRYTERYGEPQAKRFLLKLPMVTRVLQCIGRGIRNAEDRCASVILDYRVKMFPFIKMKAFKTIDEMVKTLKKFFSFT